MLYFYLLYHGKVLYAVIKTSICISVRIKMLDCLQSLYFEETLLISACVDLHIL